MMKTVIILFTIVLGFSTANAEKLKHQDITIQVTEKGFEPKQIEVLPGTDVTLKVTRKTDNTCAGEISIPDREITKTLPLNKTVSIRLGKLNNGQIKFACGMKMVKGLILVH